MSSDRRKPELGEVWAWEVLKGMGEVMETVAGAQPEGNHSPLAKPLIQTSARLQEAREGTASEGMSNQ